MAQRTSEGLTLGPSVRFGWRRLAVEATALAVPVGGFVIWWFASANSTSPFYPPLSSIVDAFADTWVFERFGSDVLPSLARMFAGLGIAIIAGTALGTLMGRLYWLHRAFDPILQFCRALPATALVPVSIVLLGIGTSPKVSLIAFVTTFPILLNAIDGVRSVTPEMEDVARSFRLTGVQRVLQIQLPSAAPQIFAGIRISLSIAFVMMVVTEMVAANNGIGYVTLLAQQNFHVPEMWSGILLLGICGIVLNWAFAAAERAMLGWYMTASREG